MKNKKAQNEIVGFAVIIIMVAVVGVIFLSLSIGRGEVVRKTSAEISDFLQSSIHVTSSCATDYAPNYKDLQDLIKACYRGQNCISDDFGEFETTCEVLEKEYSELVKNSFKVSEVGNNKAYTLDIYYSDLDIDSPREYIMNFSEGVFGNCSSEAGASQEIYFSPGNIVVELDFCYGE